MEQHETGNYSFCISLYDLSVSESRTSETPGLLQPLEILEWKWEYITMGFVSRLPNTSKDNDAIWITMDHRTKSAQFIPMKIGNMMHTLALA